MLEAAASSAGPAAPVFRRGNLNNAATASPAPFTVSGRMGVRRCQHPPPPAAHNSSSPSPGSSLRCGASTSIFPPRTPSPWVVAPFFCQFWLFLLSSPRKSRLCARIPNMYSNYVFHHLRIPRTTCMYSPYYMYIFHVLHVCIPRATYMYSTCDCV